MAIEAKISLLNQMEKRLSSEITAETMARIMVIVSDVLEEYEIREAFFEGERKDDLLDSYMAALKVEGRSQKTIDRYYYVIGKMMKAVGVNTRKITVYHLRGYLAKEKERGISDRTMEGERQIFSGYFNWLQRESLIERNPVANLGPIKCAKKKKNIYSEVDIEKLNQCCHNVRDRAIIAFLGATGCRISEAIELNRDSVNLDALECVVRGKGNKERTVFINPVTAMLIERYIKERKDANEALFAGRNGRRLLPGGVRTMLKKVAAEAGVENVYPHKFRRTLATNLTRHGMPVQEVASILGHEKLDTTMKYVVLNNEDIKNSYKRYS